MKTLRGNEERLKLYGVHRCRGSRRRGRGRRSILRVCPEQRDRSGLPIEDRVRLLTRDLEILHGTWFVGRGDGSVVRIDP